MADGATTVPQALLHNLKHNQVLHQRNLIVTVVFDAAPWVPMERTGRRSKPLGRGFWRVVLHFGFMNTPDVPKALSNWRRPHGLQVPLFECSATSSAARPWCPRADSRPARQWRERLFAAMSRQAVGVVEFFRLPGNAVVELGTRVQI